MLMVWGRTNSSNVMKVLWLLEELGLRYERTDAGGPFGGTATPDYRAMSPLGLVPALRDGETALFESNTILRYLCNRHAAESALYPRGAVERGAVEAWMDVQLSSFQPAFGVVFQGLVRTPPEQRDDAAIAAALKRVGDVFALLDERLRERAFLAGDALTLADIVFGPNLHRWFNMQVARPDQPALRAWHERLLARPAYVGTCAVAVS